MNERTLLALVMATFALLTVVVVVGLAQKSLDTTGVALALCGLLFGGTGGFVARLIKNPPEKHTDEGDEK